MPVLKLPHPFENVQPISQLASRVEVGFWYLSETADELAALWPKGAACFTEASSRFTSAKRICEWMAVRAYIAQSTFASPDDILYTPQGKPYFLCDNRFISISHTKKWIAVALAPCKVGVDVELKSSRAYKIRDKFLLPSEIDLLGRVDNPEQEALRMWTVKEAAFKMHDWQAGGVLTDIVITQREACSSILSRTEGREVLYHVSFPGHEVSEVLCCEYDDFMLSICMNKIF